VAETSTGIVTCVAGGLALSYQPYLEALFKREVSIASDDAALIGLYHYAKQMESG